MNPQRPPFPALALTLCAALGAGCVTETTEVRKPAGVRTEGVIVSGPVEAVWGHAESVISSIATGPLTSRGLPHSLRTEVNGTLVEAFAEPYDTERTILHVTSDDPALADQIRLRVMNP